MNDEKTLNYLLAALGAVVAWRVLNAIGEFAEEARDVVAPPTGAKPLDSKPIDQNAPIDARPSGVIVDMLRVPNGWDIVTEVTNPSDTPREVALQLYAKNRYNVGFGEDEIIDITRRVTLDARSTTPVTFHDSDLAFSVYSSWEVALFADKLTLATAVF